MSIYDVIGSGMTANKLWLDVTANNIANINTTRTSEGGPYKRQNVVFEEKTKFNEFLDRKIGGGVQVGQVITDPTEKVVLSPDHPDANEEGYVRLPAINMAAEMTNMIKAQRGYEANVTTFNTIKKAMDKTAEIGRV